MATVRVPLELELIDQGLFLLKANGDLRKMQAGLIAFRKEHGPLALGEKAKLTIEVTLCIEPGDQVSVKAATKTIMPGRPPSVTTGIESETQTGEPAVLVPRSGSTQASPQQGSLTTQDGRVIDQTTGDVKPPSAV